MPFFWFSSITEYNFSYNFFLSGRAVETELLTCVSGNNLDAFAFDECDLSEKEVDKIISEANNLNNKRIDKILSKYGINKNVRLASTKDIINLILYE